MTCDVDMLMLLVPSRLATDHRLSEAAGIGRSPSIVVVPVTRVDRFETGKMGIYRAGLDTAETSAVGTEPKRGCGVAE